MSNATKCDRCGAVYKGIEGIVILPSHDDDFDLCADCMADLAEWMDCQPITDAPERVTNEGELLHDTREKLEEIAWEYDASYAEPYECGAIAEAIIELLDRQAAITERECAHCAYAQPTDLTDGCELAQRIQALEREIATLKEHRASNMEKLRELTDECAELRKYRDEWKGLAEKYRADSIAAQDECERYREKLGDVLDALHEAERAAR